MILEWNTCRRKTSTTCQRFRKHTTRSLKTGKERSFQALTWSGTTLLIMRTELAACPQKTFDHPAPKRRQLSPHRCRKIKYDSKVHHAHKEDTLAPLDAEGIQRVETIARDFLWIGRAVNNKLLVAAQRNRLPAGISH